MDSDKEKVIALALQGHSCRRICAETGVSRSTVSRWIAASGQSAPATVTKKRLCKDVPWANTLTAHSEAFGHGLAARILELAEPVITRAIRESAWRAIQEIAEADRAA